MDLMGQVAIVTGAGRGLGAGIARCLAAAGAAVIIAELDQDRGQAAARTIIEAGGQATCLATDVSSEEAVNKLVEYACQEFGRVDILVNNAGIYPKSLVVDMPWEQWQAVINTNLKSAFLTMRAVLPVMIGQKSGRIINIGSGHSYRGGANFSHYASTKAGVIALSKSVALEVAQHNILVNAVSPGTSDTDMPRQYSSEEDMTLKARNIPLGRLGRPEDIGEMVVFLASPHNSFITGQAIYVNGGSVRP